MVSVDSKKWMAMNKNTGSTVSYKKCFKNSQLIAGSRSRSQKLNQGYGSGSGSGKSCGSLRLRLRLRNTAFREIKIKASDSCF